MLNAQSAEVKAEFDTSEIRIGEPFHLNLHVIQSRGLKVEFPPIGNTLAGRIEVLESSAADTSVSDDKLQIQKQYSLTCFDSGFYEIPPLVFGVSEGDLSDSIITNPLSLVVHTVAVDSTIYDIKEPMHVPVGFMEVFPYAAGGLVLLLAAGLLVRHLRKRKGAGPIFAPARPEEPAHVTALRELDALKEEKLWQKNEFKLYYSRLTEIIRQYMERRYGIPAMEMTSYDIYMAWMQSGEDRDDLSGQLNLLLNLADLVKFAKEKPVASDNEENMERAYDFVHRTKLVKPLYGEDHEVNNTEEGKIPVENE